MIIWLCCGLEKDALLLFFHQLLANISDVRAEGVQSVLQPPTRLQRAPDYAGNRLEPIQSNPECLYDRGRTGETPDRRIIVRLLSARQ